MRLAKRESRPAFHSPVKRAAFAAAIAGAAILLGAQWSLGVWEAGWGPDADSPAHLVSALLIQEYAATALPAGRPPLEFALDFYHRFPKVAIGHWPPVYHASLALWMALTPRTSAWIHAFQALLAGLIAAFTALLASYVFTPPKSLLAGIVAAAAPVILNVGCSMLADTMLAALAAGALLALASYWRRPGWKPAAWFAAAATAALLTKPTGVVLLAILPLAVLVRRRWSLLRRPSFWWPMLIAVLLAGPWYLVFFKDALEGYRASGPLLRRLVRVPLLNFEYVARVLGLAATGFAAYGAWRLRRGATATLLACSVAASYSMFAFIVPSRALRHFAPLAPALAVFCVAGLTSALRALAGKGARKLALRCAWVILPLIVLSARVPVRDSGVRAMVAALLAERPAPHTWLVAGSAAFEGDVIAEAALHRPSGGLTVYRASKLFMRGGWDPRTTRLAISSPLQAARLIESCDIHSVIVGKGAPAVVAQALSGDRARWRPRHTGLKPEAGIVYQRAGGPVTGLDPPFVQKP